MIVATQFILLCVASELLEGIAWPNYITLNRYNSFKRIKAAPIRHWTGKTVVLTINKTVTRFPTASVKPTANFTGVMILTYMRSGSSLTGDILQHSPDAFYVYEPMHEFNVDNLPYTPPVNLTFVNGTRRLWPFNFTEEAVNIIRHWLICDIFKLPRKCLLDSFLGIGIKSKVFTTCYYRNVNQVKCANKRRLFQMCANKLKTVCEQSPIRIVKTIRLQLSHIRHLLDEFQWLKIVHLVRDPRATLLSQRRVANCNDKHGGIDGCAREHCHRQENDLKEFDILARKHPGRISRVLYEDIATKPIETSRTLFDFIGATFTPLAQEYIYNITLAGNEDNGVIGTTRINSSAHIDAWKNTMQSDFVNVTNKHCDFVLKQVFRYRINLT